MSATIRIVAARVELGGAAVVDGVSIEVGAGEWVTVVGPNGAGKTTLLKALAGLLPASGEIEINGHPVSRLDRRHRARLVALVPQLPEIPAGITVVDYVLLARTPYLGLFDVENDDDRAAVRHALTELDIVDLADRELITLSGGERQRVVLARALAQETPVLLMDEPTSALDIGHQQDVLDLIEKLRKAREVTVVSTMHDLTLAGQYADRLILMDEGRIAAEGTASTVLTEQSLARHYDARVQVIEGPDGPAIVPVRGRGPKAQR